MEWLAFLALIAALLYLDLHVLNREAHAIDVPEALKQSAMWIGLACLFGGLVWWQLGATHGAEYFTAYIIEKSLSVDNLFVFLAIFTYFKVPSMYQHRVLYWGIIGAIVLRFAAIAGGVSLLHVFHGLTYVFGAILVWTAWKVVSGGEQEETPFDQTPFAIWLQKHLNFNFTEDVVTRGNFLIQEPLWNADHPTKVSLRWVGTKLLFVLLIVEFTDLLFATDSIPAALACSDNAFVIFSSNIFAVLGLRSLYFALSAMMGKFQFLKYGVSAVLALIGVKMLVAQFFTAPTALWLMAVAIILGTSVGASIMFPETETA